MIRVEDWAPRDKLHRSYELLARYVMPHFQGSLIGIETSNQWAAERIEVLQANRYAGLKAATDTFDRQPQPQLALPGGEQPMEITREDLHKLVDYLPECEWEVSYWVLLAHLKQHDPLLWRLMTAPEDDEEDLPRRNVIAVAEAEEDIKAGRLISHLKKLRRRFGITPVNRRIELDSNRAL